MQESWLATIRAIRGNISGGTPGNCDPGILHRKDDAIICDIQITE